MSLGTRRAGALLATVLLAAGCSSEPAPAPAPAVEPSPTRTATAEPSPAPAPEPTPTSSRPTGEALDRLFLQTLRENVSPSTAALPDSRLIGWAADLCVNLDAGAADGAPAEDLILAFLIGVTSANVSDAVKEDAGTIAGMGIAAYCPQYGPALLDLADSL